MVAIITTSLPYFGVKLSCICLLFAYSKDGYPKLTYSCPKVTYSGPKVTYSDPKMTHGDLTHLPFPPPNSLGPHQPISL